MRNPEQTVGNMADKLKTAFIGSVDANGYPCIKAMLQPRKREGIKTFYFTTNTSSMRVKQLDYCVLKFTAVSGRFYSNFHSEDFVVD